MKRRSISPTMRARIFLAADGVCHICGGKIVNKPWQVEHVIPLALGGKDDEANMRPAHTGCHRGKTDIDVPRIARAKRRQIKHLGAYRSSNPMPGSKASPWKKKMSGETVRR